MVLKFAQILAFFEYQGTSKIRRCNIIRKQIKMVRLLNISGLQVTKTMPILNTLCTKCVQKRKVLSPYKSNSLYIFSHLI